MSSMLEAEGDAVRNIGEELGKLTSTRSRARVLRLVLDSLDETEGITGLPGGRTKALLAAGLAEEEPDPIPLPPPDDPADPEEPSAPSPRALIAPRSPEPPKLEERVAEKLVAEGYPYDRALRAAKKAIREVGEVDGLDPLLAYGRSILGPIKRKKPEEMAPQIDPNSPAVVQTVDFIMRNPNTTVRAIAGWAGLSISGAGARTRSAQAGGYVDQPTRGSYVVTEAGKKAVEKFKRS